MTDRTNLLGTICLDAVNTLAQIPDAVVANTKLMAKTVIINEEFAPKFLAKMDELRVEIEADLNARGIEMVKVTNPTTTTEEPTEEPTEPAAARGGLSLVPEQS